MCTCYADNCSFVNNFQARRVLMFFFLMRWFHFSQIIHIFLLLLLCVDSAGQKAPNPRFKPQWEIESWPGLPIVGVLLMEASVTAPPALPPVSFSYPWLIQAWQVLVRVQRIPSGYAIRVCNYIACWGAVLLLPSHLGPARLHSFSTYPGPKSAAVRHFVFFSWFSDVSAQVYIMSLFI